MELELIKKSKKEVIIMCDGGLPHLFDFVNSFFEGDDQAIILNNPTKVGESLLNALFPNATQSPVQNWML